MISIANILHGLFRRNKQEAPDTTQGKNIALVLGGGGARGYAHIGAIEVLLENGYNITSIAGTSMGALVGGLYAAGKIKELKETSEAINRKKMFKIFNLSLGKNHLTNGNNLMEIIDDIIGDVEIENLPIDFCCCATDIVTGKEKVFRDGSLKTAIRASISIPCVFKPVTDSYHIYIDGSIHNTLPLDRVKRHEGDILVAVNVSAPDSHPYTSYLEHTSDTDDDSIKSIWKKFFNHNEVSANYFNIMQRVAKISIQNNTQMAMRLTPPDICAEIPMDSFNILEFNKATEIIAMGREAMKQALQRYNEQKVQNQIQQ